MARSKSHTAATESAETPLATSEHEQPTIREPGDEAEQPRKYAPDPFSIASDTAAGVTLRESRRFRRAEIAFADGKPSQQVIDQLKTDQFQWRPQEKLWVRPIKGEDAMATRIEAERTYQAVAALLREEKGIAGSEKSHF